MDLLALDPQGRLVIIEIKKHQIDRKTLGQILDYASCLAESTLYSFSDLVRDYVGKRYNQPFEKMLEQRNISPQEETFFDDIQMVVVGTGRGKELDRIVRFLSQKYSMPITAVSFEIFRLSSGERFMIREVEEAELSTVTTTQSKYSVDKIIDMARHTPIFPSFNKLIEIAKKHGLYLRPFKESIMIAPQAKKTRALYTVWGKPENHRLKVWIGPKSFSEFFSVSEEECHKQFGTEGWSYLDEGEVDELTKKIDSFLSQLHKTSNETEEG